MKSPANIPGALERLALDNRPAARLIVFACFSAAYFADVCFRASRKQLWFDELLTVFIAALAVSLHSAAAPRYALPAVIGFAIALSFGAYAIGERIAALASICIVLSFGLSWIMRDRVVLFARPGEQIYFHLLPASVPDSALKSGLPVVITDGSAFLELCWNRSPSVRDKIVYLADPAASRKYIHMDNTDLQLSALHQWAPIPVQSYEAFLAVYPRFLLFGSASMWEWQISKLVDDGAKFEKVGPNVYRVELPKAGAVITRP